MALKSHQSHPTRRNPTLFTTQTFPPAVRSSSTPHFGRSPQRWSAEIEAQQVIKVDRLSGYMAQTQPHGLEVSTGFARLVRARDKTSFFSLLFSTLARVFKSNRSPLEPASDYLAGL